MSLRTCTLEVGASALFVIRAYPLCTFLTSVSLLGMGFFSQGFFVSSLIYINKLAEIDFELGLLWLFTVYGLFLLCSTRWMRGWEWLDRWAIICLFL